MSKWADYAIVEVKYTDSACTRIDTVKRRADSGSSLDNETLRSRTGVINDIRNGWTYVTAPEGSDGKWTRGEDVRIVSVDGTDYIRTDANHTKADNLGELPRF